MHKTNAITAYLFFCSLTFVSVLYCNAQCSDPTNLVVDNMTSSVISFHWDAISGAVGYEYAVTSSNTAPASGTATTSNAVTNAPVPSDGTTYVYVRTACSGGLFSNWISICKATPSTLGGSGAYCMGSSLNIGIPLTLSGQTYNWINTTSGVTSGPVSGNGSNQSYTDALTSSRVGTWKVTTASSGCQSTDFGNVVITQMTPPSSLFITYSDSKSVSFSWSAVPGVGSIDGYQYSVDELSDVPDITSNTTQAAYSTSASVNNLSPTTLYYIHVRGNETGRGYFTPNLACNSSWATLSFTTSVLPVRFEYFMAKKTPRGNYLSWKADCINDGGSLFEIQRSDNGIAFTTIGVIKADQQNCAAPLNYTDSHAASSSNFYRIRSTENSGKISYSSILHVDGKLSNTSTTIFPNPIQQNSIIELNLDKASLVNITITDLNGKLISVPMVGKQLDSGLYQLPLHVENLHSGIYLCKVSVNQTETVLKVIKF